MARLDPRVVAGACLAPLGRPYSWHLSRPLAALGAELAARLRSRLGPGVQLLVRTAQWRRLDRPDTRALLLRALGRVGAPGVAVTDVRVSSGQISLLAAKLEALLGVLPQPSSLLLGLDLADSEGKGALVARRMAPLLELANLVVLQTHFTRHWRFCRAAHVSLYAPPTSDACPQSTPALTALEWMSRLEPSSTPVCLSFNMAAVEFRGLAHPSAGSPCETSREIAPPCAGYGWQSGRDSNASLTAQAYRDDVWISQETGALLREKLLMASRRLPKLCVAVFNVDMDSPALAAEGRETRRFPESRSWRAPLVTPSGGRSRLKTVCWDRVIGQTHEPETRSSHHSTTAAVVSSATKPSSALALFREPAHNSPTGFLFADDVASTGAAQPPSSRALVCVLSPAAIHLDRFPAHLCSYLVFTRRLDAEQATPPDVLPLSGSRFASFLKLCARTRTPAVVATVPSALSGLFAGGALSEAPARRLSVSLLKAGLGGMAVFAAPDEDLALLDQYLEVAPHFRKLAKCTV
ncbi:hypothetical protein ISCGN_012940 [Ixodes scapularis]